MDVTFEFAASSVHPFSIIWSFRDQSPHFTIHNDLPEGAPLTMVVERWYGLVPLFKRFIAREGAFEGSIVINFNDGGIDPGLAFCDCRPEFTLIPDPVFVGSHAYEYARGHFANARDWSDRSDIVFWRGASTGFRADRIPALPRAHLCEIARSENAERFDVGITQITDVDNEQMRLIEERGYLKPFESWEGLDKYKFNIDIDGHTNSWPGLMLKLHSGGLVLKVDPPEGNYQWYYDRLRPWENYVPVKSDMSDLLQLVSYFRSDDAAARKIALEGRRLAMSMELEAELDHGVSAIAAHLLKEKIKRFRG